MKWIKFAVGLLAGALGIIGLVACLAAIVGVWATRERIDQTVTSLFDRVDHGLTRVETRAEQTSVGIQKMRDAAHEMNVRVQRRVAQLQDVPLDDAHDIDQIEREIYARLQLGRSWIEFIDDTADVVGQLFEMVEAASRFLHTEPQARTDLLAAIRAGKEEVREVFQLVDSVQIHLLEIRENRDIEENARQIKTISSSINTLLVSVQTHVDEFRDGLTEVRSDIANIGSTIREQLLVGALAVTLLLLWLSAAQLSLSVHGWRFLRS